MKSTLLLLLAFALTSCAGFFEAIDKSPLAQKAGNIVDAALIYSVAKGKIDGTDAASLYALKTVTLDSTLTPEERQKALIKAALDEAVKGGAIDAADRALVESIGTIVLPDKTVAPDGKTVVPVLPADPEPTAASFLDHYRTIHRAEDVRPAPILGNEPAQGLVAYTARF